jgi:hypothetical protein
MTLVAALTKHFLLSASFKKPLLKSFQIAPLSMRHQSLLFDLRCERVTLERPSLSLN